MIARTGNPAKGRGVEVTRIVVAPLSGEGIYTIEATVGAKVQALDLTRDELRALRDQIDAALGEETRAAIEQHRVDAIFTRARVEMERDEALDDLAAARVVASNQAELLDARADEIARLRAGRVLRAVPPTAPDPADASQVDPFVGRWSGTSREPDPPTDRARQIVAAVRALVDASAHLAMLDVNAYPTVCVDLTDMRTVCEHYRADATTPDAPVPHWTARLPHGVTLIGPAVRATERAS